MYPQLNTGNHNYSLGISIKGIKYSFKAISWKYQGKGGWYFVSLPQKLSGEIRENLKWQEEGWGRLKAVAKAGDTEWKTAIWFDTKKKTYLLPIKAEVRKKEGVEAGKSLNIIVWI